MTISNIQAAGIALIPGIAESIETHATYEGNLAWAGMAKGVKYARNALYFTGALTIIAATGAALANGDSTTTQYACTTVATLSAGVATLAANKLYKATSFLQAAADLGARPV